MIAANDVLQMALSLPTDQRVQLAHRLIESLPNEQDWPVILDDDLKREIARRIEDRRTGKSKTVDFETFKATVRGCKESDIMRVTFDEQAQQEAREHVAWYKSRDPLAAERLAELFISTAERIARNPFRFPLMEGEDNPGDVRRARLDEFPVVVVYQMLDEEAFVVALPHTSREPWYWRGRLRR